MKTLNNTNTTITYTIIIPIITITSILSWKALSFWFLLIFIIAAIYTAYEQKKTKTTY